MKFWTRVWLLLAPPFVPPFLVLSVWWQQKRFDWMTTKEIDWTTITRKGRRGRPESQYTASASSALSAAISCASSGLEAPTKEIERLWLGSDEGVGPSLNPRIRPCRSGPVTFVYASFWWYVMLPTLLLWLDLDTVTNGRGPKRLELSQVMKVGSMTYDSNYAYVKVMARKDMTVYMDW